MAIFWTLGEIVTKINRDLDLEAEVFVQPEELVDYINEAIDEAESEIHTIYEDYFLDFRFLDLAPGAIFVDLPEGIYAHKIRKIIYSDGGTRVYEIPRVKDMNKFRDIAVTERFSTSDFYRYIITNQTPGNPQIYLVPAIRTADSGNDRVRVWFLRGANRLVNQNDICDIPEFVHFVIAAAKLRCLEKEFHPGTGYWSSQKEQLRRQMVDTLSSMVPDDENQYELDMTHYEELS